jgi:diguanylate cyclase (GGDEF)-like protein
MIEPHGDGVPLSVQDRSDDWVRQIVHGTPVPTFVIDATHRVTHWNPACEAVTGTTAHSIIGTRRSWAAFYASPRPVMADLIVDGILADQVDTYYGGKCRRSATVPGTWEAEDFFPHFPDGGKWLAFSAAPLRDAGGAVVGAIETLQDITAQKAYEVQLEHQATHDALTGLANRFLFEDRLTQALAHARRAGGLVGLLFVDLDHFKVINDTLGHAAGDEVVKVTARRIAESVRAGDTVARLGGDEFAILLVAPDCESVVADIIQRLITDVSAPVSVGGETLVIGCSVGAALFPRDGKDGSELLMHADSAMYRAKESGRSTFQFFTSEMNDQACERLMLERDLRRALEQGEFDLHFQPQVNLFTDVIIGAEALLRWNHPTLGMISPERFIPVAEETGLVIPLGRWVIDQACQLGRQWTADGRRLRVSVNLSARQFHDPGLVQQVAAAMTRWGTDSLAFDLELTESTVMKDSGEAAAILNRLKDQGVRLSMDDFGTGYSSLGQLRAFPFDMIKIDRSFILDLHSGHGAEAVVRAIIGLAESLNLAIIAEGVETTRQRDFLCAEGCIEAQGFLYSKALPAAEFTRLLHRPVQPPKA